MLMTDLISKAWYHCRLFVADQMDCLKVNSHAIDRYIILMLILYSMGYMCILH